MSLWIVLPDRYHVGIVPRGISGSGYIYVQLLTDIVNPIIEKGLKWTTRNKYEMLVYI